MASCSARTQAENRRKSMLPLLSTPTTGRDHILYSWEDKIYTYQYPGIEGRFLGSSHGCLAFHGEEDSSITLLKPFSGRILRLPPLKEPPQPSQYGEIFAVFNVILSCDPFLHPNDYTVVAEIGHDVVSLSLAFLKSGEQSWTYLENPSFLAMSTCFGKGQLYAITMSNNVMAIDNSGKATFISAGPGEEADFDYVNSHFFSYLVESLDGELLVVRRLRDEFVDNAHEYGDRFSVYKMVKGSSDDVQEKVEWVKTESLGDSAIFVAYDQCRISTAYSPYIKRNCIYCKHSSNCLRIFSFDLKSKQIESCYEFLDSRISGWAVWILPTLF